LDIAKQHVERAFGAKIAKRLDTFEDGTFYVSAGEWVRLLSWLVDFVVCAGRRVRGAWHHWSARRIQSRLGRPPGWTT
jgi:hypothetical protein